VSSNLCVAVPDGATELERLRDRNQGIAPPSNADLIAIIRAILRRIRPGSAPLWIPATPTWRPSPPVR